MPVRDAVGDYLRLAWRTDRLRPGTTCATSGDRREAVEAWSGAAPSPASLVQAAGRLASRLPDLGLDPARERFWAAQLVALEWTARRLAGQRVAFVDEVAAACQVDVALGPEDEYRAAHRELDALLPGPGALVDRIAAHRARDEIPVDRLEVAIGAVAAALRERAVAAGLVTGAEEVRFRLVADAPWAALHRPLGTGADGVAGSQVVVNAGARLRRGQLAPLVAHETYPGHHVEHLHRAAVLVGERGWGEHGVTVTGTPQNVIAEGAAERGLAVLVGPRWGSWAADVLADVGLGFDGELAERVHRATSRLARVRQDAALQLHGHRARPDDVLAHLRRWLLVDEPRARRVLRFVADPLWRTQTVTYVAGAELVGRWLERPGPAPVRRLRALHTEPWTPADLRAGVDAAPDEGENATDGACQAMNGGPLR